jgi:hypothetical protein
MIDVDHISPVSRILHMTYTQGNGVEQACVKFLQLGKQTLALHLYNEAGVCMCCNA